MKRIVNAVIAVVMLAGIAGAAGTSWNVDVFKGRNAGGKWFGWETTSDLKPLAQILLAAPALPEGCTIDKVSLETGNSLSLTVKKGEDTASVTVSTAYGIRIKNLPDGGKHYDTAMTAMSPQVAYWHLTVKTDAAGKITYLRAVEELYDGIMFDINGAAGPGEIIKSVKNVCK